MSDHSPIPPSSAHIWAGGGCTGWMTMMKSVEPLPESIEAAEGTATHEIGALNIDRELHGGLGRVLRAGDTASNGVVITEEMVDCAEIYSDDVITEYRARVCKGGLQHGGETRVECPNIHPESFGTTDYWMYDPHEGLLIIWEYKHGHLVVSAERNWQQANYTDGIIPKLAKGSILRAVEFRVIQPRALRQKNVPARWRVLIEELEPMFDILHQKAHESFGPDPQCVTGHNCRRCDARHICGTYLTASFNLYEAAGSPAPIDLSPPALGRQLVIIERAMEALKGLQTGYEAQIDAMLRSGKQVPWWTLEPVNGREEWTRPAGEVIALGDLLGIDLRKEALITPNQARKAGIDKETVAAYSDRKSGLKLTRDDGEKVRRVFECGD